MKADFHPIILQPGESFTCVEWRSMRDFPYLGFCLEYALIAILEGQGTRCVGDNVEQFGKHDLVLLGPKLPNYWVRDVHKAEQREHHISATFDEAFLGRGFFQRSEAAPIRQLLAHAQRGVAFPRSLCARLKPDLLRLTRLKGWTRLCLFLEVLGKLAAAPKWHLLTSPSFSSELATRDLGRLSAVCKYVHESYGDEIWEKKAAALAGFSPAPFSRFFHKYMGLTFVAYVTEVRIGQACRRLAERNTPIVEVAFETGFNNLSNFNRHFLKLKGMTPRAYRRHMQDQ